MFYSLLAMGPNRVSQIRLFHKTQPNDGSLKRHPCFRLRGQERPMGPGGRRHCTDHHQTLQHHMARMSCCLSSLSSVKKRMYDNSAVMTFKIASLFECSKHAQGYMFNGMEDSPNLCIVMTHCSPRQLRLNEEEKAKWLNEQSEENINFRSLYQVVGNDPSRVFLVDNKEAEEDTEEAWKAAQDKNEKGIGALRKYIWETWLWRLLFPRL